MTARLCSECVRCEDCSDIAYCLEDAMPPPCPHDRALCGECILTSCPQCRHDALAEMCESGEYDPRLDPLYDHTAPEPVDRIERDGGYEWEGRWIEVPRRAEQRDAELARLLDVDGCFEELNKQAEEGRPE